MLNKKVLLLSLVMCLGGISVGAETLQDVTYPKAPAYRVGISEYPENQYVQAKQVKPKIEKAYGQIDTSIETGVSDLTYADLSIKRLSKEIAQELEMDEQDMISDLSLLWQGAAMQSDTINFALYKLANPDADKPDSKSIKNVLKTIASMSTLVGASMGSPVLAGSSLIGGNILGIMSQDTKALNYKYTKVTDADMIILIRKIEDLQQNAVNLYYDYISAKKQLEMTTKLVEDRQKKFELAQQNNAQRELVVITDAYYRTAIDKQRSAKSEFFAKRAALEQFVGNETFVQFENELEAREKGEKTSTQSPKTNDDNEPTYADTIQNVENYTNNLNTTKSNQTVENASTPPVYTEDGNDPNLDKMPELQPLNIKSETPKQIEENKENENLVQEEKTKAKLSDKFHKVKKEKDTQTVSPKEKVKSKKKSAQITIQDELASKVEPTTDEVVSEPKVTKPKKTKADKYSTKGFIFIHNNTQSPQQETSQCDDSYSFDKLDPIVPDNTQSVNNKEIKGLPPLDAIKAPDLDGHGYSIFSDGDY